MLTSSDLLGRGPLPLVVAIVILKLHARAGLQDATFPGRHTPSGEESKGPLRLRLSVRERTLVHAFLTAAGVKGFGCRPHEGERGVFGRPASESLQGRKPRLGNVERCGRRYGDLSAAGELSDLDRADATSRTTVRRLTNERRLGSNSMSCPTICDGWRISERTLPWLVESRRSRRADGRDCEAVTRCRS